MADRRWRQGMWGLLVAAMVVSFAGCTGSGHSDAAASSAAASASAAAKASRLSSEEKLRAALLTRVNGVAPAAPASIGDYGTLASVYAGSQGAAGGQVTPKACAASARDGFEPAALRSAEAATVTFKVAKNLVSEVLIASSGSAATTAISGVVPAQCTHYVAKAGGKSVTYSVSQAAVTGIGRQAKALDVHPSGGGAQEMWSLIYRGAGFVGTVTVVGPNASEKAVQELGQQAYAFAAKTLA
jgi:hypothetical protein